MNIEHIKKSAAKFGVSLLMRAGIVEEKRMAVHYHVECFGSDGKLKWEDRFHNLVVDEGLDDSLDKHLKGSSYTATFFVGLTDGAPTPAAGDDMTTHGGWAEATPYSEGVRETLTLGSVTAQSVDNSASKASFSINTGDTVGGAFVTTDNTKGGSSGILYGIGAFTGGDRIVANNDTLNVTVTLTAAAS